MKKFILIVLMMIRFIFSQEDIKIDELRNLSIADLMEIKLVTAAKNPEDILDIPASVMVITAKDIEKLGYRSYLEILDFVPGFYMINDFHYLGHKNFGVRGFFSPGAFGNVIVLVNGVPQLSDEYMDYPDTKITVPVEAIDRIEVIRGPMSVIYGNGAFFGAINIITNKNYDKNRVAIGGGNYGQRNAAVQISGDSDEIKFRMNAGVAANSGINIKYTDITSATDLITYSGNEVDASTDNMLESGRKYADFSFKKDAIFGTFSYNESLTEIMDGIPSVGAGSEISHHSANINLGYDKRVNENLNMRGLIGYYFHYHKLDYEKFIIHSGDVDSKKSGAYDLDLTANYNTNKFKILLGGYLRSVEELLQVADFPLDGLSRGDGEIMIPRNDRILTKSLYSQVTYHISTKLDLIGGIRIEHLSPYTISYNRGVVTRDTTINLPLDSRTNINGKVTPPNDGFAITPRVSLLFDLNSRNVLKLMYGSAIKQPTFMDNLRQIIMQRPFLNVQKIETWEFNITSILNNQCRTNISFFYNQLYDLITATNEYSPESGWTIFSANSGQMSTFGLEACTMIDFTDKLSTRLSFLYQKTHNDKRGYSNYEPGYSPNFLGYLYMNYQFSPGYNISLIGKYVDQMETEWITSSIPEDGARLAKASPAYYLLSGNLLISNIFDSQFTLNIGIKNILDQEIRYPTTKSNSWIDKGYPGFGRRFYTNISYEF